MALAIIDYLIEPLHIDKGKALTKEIFERIAITAAWQTTLYGIQQYRMGKIAIRAIYKTQSIGFKGVYSIKQELVKSGV